MDFEEILKILKEKSNKDLAVTAKNYMKSNLEFLGINNPELRQLAKEIYKENKEEINYILINKLWRSKIFEAMYLALYTLELYSKIYDDKAWRRINEMVEDVENWAHCDQLCNLRSYFWQRKDFLATLFEWTKSDNLWKRRSAAVSLLAKNPVRIPFSFEEAIKVLDPLMYDKEYFVQKGVGWMLKVLYQQYPDKAFDYLLEHKNAPRVTLRTACEKMSAEDRNKVLFEK
jgi:3-methyladenine DNA glycosylase AlkD